MNLKDLLKGKPKKLIYVKDDAHISYIYDAMKSNRVHHIAVLHNQIFLGLIDQEAILDAIMISPLNFNSLVAKDIMRRHIPSVLPEHTIEDVVRMMKEKNLRALPYFENDRCVSLITRTDLLKLVNELLLDHESLLDRAKQQGDLAMTNPLVRNIAGILADIGI